MLLAPLGLGDNISDQSKGVDLLELSVSFAGKSLCTIRMPFNFVF